MSWIQTLGLGDLREGKNQVTVKLMCMNNETHTYVRNLMERLKHSPLLAAISYSPSTKSGVFLQESILKVAFLMLELMLM